MLNGREKIGQTNIDWQRHAFGAQKSRRKTVGFGKYDKRSRTWSDVEIYIRELSIVEAGIGCALWDASIILSRWLYENRAKLAGMSVLELGSGCGLPGITAALFAKHVILSDYIPQVLDNLAYNVKLNQENDTNTETDMSTPQEGGSAQQSCSTTKVVKRLCPVDIVFLDWDEIDDSSKHPLFPPVDIIIGSELTYSTLSVHTLVRVIDKYLKPDGVFYEVLSDDRDGVPLFLELIEKQGFECHHAPVPERFLGNYGTGQRPETYQFYTCRRQGLSRHGTMV